MKYCETGVVIRQRAFLCDILSTQDFLSLCNRVIFFVADSS